ncbi:MAG: hypothetical protein JW795_08300 [Chitinivibrionales bacterium]|nr:hypothetical protein [Chitinivibrionales bacterium]
MSLECRPTGSLRRRTAKERRQNQINPERSSREGLRENPPILLPHQLLHIAAAMAGTAVAVAGIFELRFVLLAFHKQECMIMKVVRKGRERECLSAFVKIT